MIDPKASEDEKLRQARKLFVEAIDHVEHSRGEMHRASRFYHNTKGEGQWEWEDLEALRDQGRPAFSFNIAAAKIRTWIGQYQDGKRKPTVMPKGGEDRLLAEVIERVCDSIYADEDVDATDEDVLEMGIVRGLKFWHPNVVPDPEDPGLIQIEVSSVDPMEVAWDPNARRADLSDGRHFFWSKWLSKGEFQSEYPEHADEWDELEEGGADESGLVSGGWGEVGDLGRNEDEYDDIREDTRLFDKNRHKIRVIHCEYLVPVKRKFVVNPENGISEKVDDEQLDLMREMGLLDGIDVTETWGDEVYTLEFIGPKLLWASTADNPYQPYDGFSLVPFVCFFDDETRTAYGMFRNLFDPQMEFNKARSVTLQHIADQPKPGLIVESDAVEDPDVFDDQLHTSGETAFVKAGAVSGGKIMPLPLPQVSPAAIERSQNGIDMLNLISNIETEVGNPAAAQEAATTHLLRYHRSRMGQRPIIAHFERGQREVKQRIVETVLRVMPDRQIEMILGNDDEWVVRDGMAYQLDQNPETGETVPVQQVPLRGLRDMRYDITLETTSDNQTLNMIEHQSLVALHGAGVPVPPELLAEGATTSRAKRDQLRKYAKDTSEAQQRQSAEMQQAQMDQIRGVLTVEHAKTQEQQRHNMSTEQLDALKALSDEQIEMLKVWEKADESEKQTMLEMAKLIESRQARRETTY